MPNSDEIVTVTYSGRSLKFHASTALIKANVERMFTREPTTIPWIATFDPSDVFVDVGANIGLYSIFAAAVVGSRVYGCEPESQNYAELNKNIFINGLHERVTGYCLALTDRQALDKLYLCEFSAGFGHHDFGTNSWKSDLHRGEVVYAKNNRLTQGAVGMTLDDLVETGAIPVPNHIKIDVDGLEWRVLAGAIRTMSRRELKSVLIETDFSSSKCLETIEIMQDMGWRYSDKQAAVFEDGVVTAEELHGRMSSGVGQQNLIYFRDGADYDLLFADFAMGYERETSRRRLRRRD